MQTRARGFTLHHVPLEVRSLFPIGCPRVTAMISGNTNHGPHVPLSQVDGPYSKGAFKFSLEFPAEYPFKAPKVRPLNLHQVSINWPRSARTFGTISAAAYSASLAYGFHTSLHASCLSVNDREMVIGSFASSEIFHATHSSDILRRTCSGRSSRFTPRSTIPTLTRRALSA